MNRLRSIAGASRLLATAAVLLASVAVAQTDTEDGEGAVRSRPPAIDIDALEPAVDVSQTRPSRQPPSSADGARPPARPEAADTLELGTTSITGNQELPKVLYIVPWKRSDLGELVGRPVNTLLEEALAPVDPEVFERRLGYYESLYEGGQQE